MINFQPHIISTISIKFKPQGDKNPLAVLLLPIRRVSYEKLFIRNYL